MEKLRWYKTTWESKDSYEVLYTPADTVEEADECARIFGERRNYRGKRQTMYFPGYDEMIAELKRQLYPPGHWIHDS